MAYKQQPGTTRGTNPSIATLTDGDKKKKKNPKSGSDRKTVKTYDIASKKSGSKSVKKGSPSAKMATEYGAEVDFGSQSQKTGAKRGEATTAKGTNRNTKATMATSGSLPANFKGKAKDSNNKTVDFSTNNNDNRRKEKFRLY
jgi:hypothetical protein